MPPDQRGRHSRHAHRRWLRFDRRRRTLWTPISMTLLCAALATLFFQETLFFQDERASLLRFALYTAGIGVQLWSNRVERKVTVAQHPELVGRRGVYLPAVSACARSPASASGGSRCATGSST